MSQHYSDPAREHYENARVTFEVTPENAWLYNMEGYDGFDPGWYWQGTSPGWVPVGPFATEAEALADARRF